MSIYYKKNKKKLSYIFHIKKNIFLPSHLRRVTMEEK